MMSRFSSDMSSRSDLVTTTKDARKVIEEIAQINGSFTDAFRQEAESEAEHGRMGMLQAMACSEEFRKNFSSLLNM
jgi:hypothetical protein